jgi:Flp pilus assembly protein TadB
MKSKQEKEYERQLKEQLKEEERVMKPYNNAIKSSERWHRARLFFYIFGIFVAFIGLIVGGGIGALIGGGFFMILGYAAGKASQTARNNADRYLRAINIHLNNNATTN